MTLLDVTRTERTAFPLWGGTATVAVADGGDLAAAERAVHGVVAEADAACSTFRRDSALCRLNATGEAVLAAGSTLDLALSAALDAAVRTDGAVDPVVGTVTLAGWSAAVLTRHATYRDVSIERVDGRVRVALPEGVRLDLGATAKAWAADRAAAEASAATGTGVLVSLLGDVAMAGMPPLEGWTVRVTDDHRVDPDAEQPGSQRVTLWAGGLTTSSTTVRRAEGSTDLHIVDPRTWRPVVSPWRTVSVAAGSALTANTASTAAIVLGRRALGWLTSTGLAARLVAHDGAVACTGGWPQADAWTDEVAG